jgi:hypothetical protein
VAAVVCVVLVFLTAVCLVAYRLLGIKEWQLRRAVIRESRDQTAPKTSGDDEDDSAL